VQIKPAAHTCQSAKQTPQIDRKFVARAINYANHMRVTHAGGRSKKSAAPPQHTQSTAAAESREARDGKSASLSVGERPMTLQPAVLTARALANWIRQQFNHLMPSVKKSVCHERIDENAAERPL
jgi:hypothetical protein